MHEGRLRKLLSDAGIRVIDKNGRGWLRVPCPFAAPLHEHGTDRNPSCFVKVEPDGYSGFNCYSCHQRGNLQKLFSRMADYAENETSRKLFRRLEIRAVLWETPEQFAEFEDSREAGRVKERHYSPLEERIYMGMYPLAWESVECRRYLLGRGLSEKTAKLLDLRFDTEERRVLFPVYDYQHRLFGFTGRTILRRQETCGNFMKVRDYAGLPKSSLLLGEHLVTGGAERPLVVVEGLFALAHLLEIGVRTFCDPVATMGSSLSIEQRDALVDWNKPVVMLYDFDRAGQIGLFGPIRDECHEGGGAVDLLRNHVAVSVAKYPEGITDPDHLSLHDVQNMVEGDLCEHF